MSLTEPNQQLRRYLKLAAALLVEGEYESDTSGRPRLMFVSSVNSSSRMGNQEILPM